MEPLWNGTIAFFDRSGYSIARVSKELLMHMTDTYVIDAGSRKCVDALMFVLAIDAENVPEN